MEMDLVYLRKGRSNARGDTSAPQALAGGESEVSSGKHCDRSPGSATNNTVLERRVYEGWEGEREERRRRVALCGK